MSALNWLIGIFIIVARTGEHDHDIQAKGIRPLRAVILTVAHNLDIVGPDEYGDWFIQHYDVDYHVDVGKPPAEIPKCDYLLEGDACCGWVTYKPLSNLESLWIDLKLLWHAFKQTRDCPPSCYVDSLPSTECMTGWLLFNQQYHDHVAELSLYYTHSDSRRYFYENAALEAQTLHDAWSKARDAKAAVCVSWQRQALRDLRTYLRKVSGDDELFLCRMYLPNGQLLPFVPYWRFMRIDP